MRLFNSILLILLPVLLFAQDHILISEIAVTPTDGEFVEIFNGTGSAIDLSNYYITDATSSGNYYYNIVTGSSAGAGNYDFHARFPAGATIAAGEAQTIAMKATGFISTYGIQPTYELVDSDAGVPNMLEAFSGGIAANAGITNAGEVIILYYWDGQSDLVQDIDYVVWGDKVEAVDKTGVSIDGPDAGPDASAYLNDTSIATQIPSAPDAPHAFGETSQRISIAEVGETFSGGNGIGGHNETSEDLASSFQAGAPSPGVGPGGSSGNQPPEISNITRDPVSPGPSDAVTVSADITDDSAVAMAKLYYSVNSAPYDSMQLALQSGDTYAADIQPQSDGTQVDYFIKAWDDSGSASNSATSSYIVTTGGSVTPISSIQTNPAYIGQIVTIEGVVTLGSGITSASWTDAYVQDSSGYGINVYQSGAIDPDLVRKNKVQITGTVAEFSGVTEIINYSVSVIASGQELPASTKISTAQVTNLSYEGTYMEIAGVITDKWSAGGGTNITVDDGSGETTVRAWDTARLDLAAFDAGDTVGIKGVMDVYNSAGQILVSYQDEIFSTAIQPTHDGAGSVSVTPDSVGTNQNTSLDFRIATGNSDSLYTISVKIPSEWSWTGNISDLTLSGQPFNNTTPAVSADSILLDNALFYNGDSVANLVINNLTSPGTDMVSTFKFKTAGFGGTLKAIASSPSVKVGEPAVSPVVPIADIQTNADYIGQVVTIEGVVTVGSGITSSGWTDAYVQDTSGYGINIYRSGTIDPNLVRKNKVQITGTVAEYNGVTEITNYTLTILATSQTLPPATKISTSQVTDLSYEGTYMELAGVITDKWSAGGGTNITVDDGSGETTVRAWDTAGLNLAAFATGDTVGIKGVMDVYNNAGQVLLAYQDEIYNTSLQASGDGSGLVSVLPDSVGLSETVALAFTFTGNNPDTISQIYIEIPAEWTWSGDSADISLGGAGFSSGAWQETANSILVSNIELRNFESGTVTISNLTSAATDTVSVFIVKSAVDGGVLTTLQNLPRVKSGQPVETPGTPIADIQGDPGYDGQTVTIEGVVTLGSGITATGWTDAYVQDNSGRGINIYRSGTLDNNLVRKHRVKITGVVDEFNGVTEITNYTLEILATGQSLPAAADLTTAQAADVTYEGTYIRVAGVITDMWSAGGGTNILLNDGSGEIGIRAWDTAGLNLTGFTTGDTVEIKGVMDIYNNASQILLSYQDEIGFTSIENAGDGSGIVTVSPDSVGLSAPVTLTFELTGNSPDTVSAIRIAIPGGWTWTGTASDVSLGGTALASAQIQATATTIDITGALLENTAEATITVENLNSAAVDTVSEFSFSTAIDNGTLTKISLSPAVMVGKGTQRTTIPLSEIQQNIDLWNGKVVTVGGVVTIGAGIITSSWTSVYIADTSGFGIQVYQGGSPDNRLKRGNLVLIRGTIEEYQGTTEITDYTLTTLKTNYPLPDPVEISTYQALNASLEGSWVKIKGNIVDNYYAGGGTNIIIDDGSGEVTVRAWDTANLNLDAFTIGEAVEAKGAIGLFDGDGQILLGYQEDINIVVLPKSPFNVVVPNKPFAPDRGETFPIVYSAGTENSQVTIRIYDLAGRLISTLYDGGGRSFEQTLNWDGRNQVNDLVPLGAYILHFQVINNDNGDTKQKVVPIVVGTVLKK